MAAVVVAVTVPPQATHDAATTTAPAPHAVAAGDTAVGRLLTGLPADSVSLAAQNVTTARSYRHDATMTVRTASVVKLDILEALLLQRQDSGRLPGEDETAQAAAMIENSDNDAATWLWNEVGGADGLRAANSRLGAAATQPDEAGYWGLTTTTADDQVALLRDLVTPGPLAPAAQSFALGLLRAVEADQTWGISAIADPGTATALKDGWLPIDDDDGLWAIGSVGIVTSHGQQVVLAVLTQHDDSLADGIQLTESLARAVAPGITSTGGSAQRVIPVCPIE